MSMREDPTEQVQLWITMAQQPGLGGWFNVWRVSQSRRQKPARPARGSAAGKKLPHGACTA